MKRIVIYSSIVLMVSLILVGCNGSTSTIYSNANFTPYDGTPRESIHTSNYTPYEKQDHNHYKNRFSNNFYDKDGCNIVGYNKKTKKFNCIGDGIVTTKYDFYRQQNNYKAFVIAMDDRGLIHGIGVSYDQKNQKTADKLALSQCNQYKAKNFLAYSKCKIHSQGHEILKNIVNQ